MDDRTGRPEQIMAPALRSIIKRIDLAIENGSLDPKDRDEVIKMFISGPTTVVDNKAGGGIASMDDMTRPIGYQEGGPVPRSRQQSLADEEAGQGGLRNLIKNYISNIRKNAFAPKQYEGGDDPEYMNKFNFFWKQGYDSQQIDAILSGQVDPTEIVPARKNLDEEFKG